MTQKKLSKVQKCIIFSFWFLKVSQGKSRDWLLSMSAGNLELNQEVINDYLSSGYFSKDIKEFMLFTENINEDFQYQDGFDNNDIININLDKLSKEDIIE